MFSEDSFYQIIFLVNGRNLLLLAWLVILLLNIEYFEYVATLEVRVSFLCLLQVAAVCLFSDFSKQFL